MPTYTSTNSSDVYGSDPYTRFAPGETETLQYVKSLPTGVTLTDHEPIVQPWALLAADDDDLIDVSAWDSIIAYNSGDTAASISANTDNSHALVLPANSQQIWDNTSRLFGCLEILSGTVSVWGSR